MLKGLERSLLEFAGEKTEGKVYVVSVAGRSAQEDVMRENGGEEGGRIMEYEKLELVILAMQMCQWRKEKSS